MQVNRFKTLDAAIKAGVVQVLNISDRNKTQPKGQLVFKIPTEGGDDVQVMLPPTWVNFDMLGYASLVDVGRSSQLRQLLRSGLVALITTDSVVKMEGLANYNDEMTRVQNLQRRVTGSAEPTSDELEINTGETFTTPFPSEPNFGEDTGPTKENYALPSSAQDLISLNERMDDNELFKAIRQAFPGYSREDFIEIGARIQNQSTLLPKLCSEALGFMDNGETVTLEELPTYQEARKGL